MNSEETEISEGRKKYNRLDLETKRQIIIEAEDKSQRYLAKKYNVSRPQVFQILKNKRKIFEQLGTPYLETEYVGEAIEEISETEHAESVEAIPIASKETKKWLTLPERKQIIDEFEGGKSKRFLAQKYQVARETINACIKRKEKICELLESSPGTTVRRVKAEKYESINKAVFESYNESIGNGHLTGTWIKKEALYFAEIFGIDTFTASNGWLNRWLKRYNIRLSNAPVVKAVASRSSAPVDIEPIYQDNSGSGAENEDTEVFATAFPFKVEMDLCRLCGTKSSFDGLCSLRDSELMIEMKLQKVFNFKLNSNKLLPQNICYQCIGSLESSVAFLEMVEETQSTLINNLNDQLRHCDASILLDSTQDIKVEELLATSMEEPSCSSMPIEDMVSTVKKKRIRNPLPTKTHNPVMRMEDIFAKELNEGVFETVAEILEVDATEQNPDGTLNEAGIFKISQLGMFNYQWKCTQCHDALPTRTMLEDHWKVHHKSLRMSYGCLDCKATFKGYLAFINHVTESHRSYMKFFCDICCDFRWNLLDLYKHREEHHPKLRSTCLYCGKIFDCGFNLKQHCGIHMKFSEEELFHCDLCEYTCHTKYLIKQHITINHVKNHGEIVCEQCGKICKRLSDMRSHQLVHTQERPHACDLCDLKFKCPKQLRCHKRTHFPRLLREECSVCQKRFLTKGKLDRHFLIHTNSFAYTCEFCGRKFKHSSGFNTHRRIHTGERPYFCTFANCGQKFIDWPNMNKHMKTKHQVDNSSRKKKIIFDHLPDDDVLM